MATSVRGTNLDEQEDDTSIIAGFSKQELLDLVKTSEITSWNGVFYHLGLPLPKSENEKSAEPLGIIGKLLTLWIERGDSSRSQLLDELDKLHERELASSLIERDSHYRLRRGLLDVYVLGRHLQFSRNLERNLRERLELAKAKLSAYLSSHLAAIPTCSNEPVETLAKHFLEGCFTEMDFSTVQEKEVILLEAVRDAGFAEVPQRFELDEIVACFQNEEQLLSMVNSLTKQGPVDKHLSLPDMHDMYGTFSYDEFKEVFYVLKRFALKRMSRHEWKSTLQGALHEAGVPSSLYELFEDRDEDEVTSWHVRIVAHHLPVEKAKDLGLALGFQKEEVDILQTLTMCNYLTYSKLRLWSKRTQFSRHRLFLALCLSGYSTFAISYLNGMNPADVYVTKSFGRSGGEVNLEDEGIQLSIPMGALPENQLITLHILEEGPLMPSAEEVSICPGFRVAPSGLSFHSRIKVTMDHSATILQQDRAGKEGIVVYVRQEEGPKELWKVVRYDLSTSADCPVEVVLTNDKIELSLTHFTSFWIRIKRAFIKNKRIACTPFLPTYMPVNRKPVLRLYIHSTGGRTRKMIQEEEKNSCPVYQRTTAHDQFLVFPNNGQGLTVTCNDEGRIVSKTVSSENLLTLRRQARNRLEFELDFSSLKHGEKNVKVDLFQGVEDERKEMIISTTFKGMESGDGQKAEEPSVLEKEPRQSREEPGVSEGEISAELDALHLESTQDMALSGAGASASLDKVTCKLLVEIAKVIPGDSFVTLFVHLGFDMDYPLKVLGRWGRSYQSASEELLSEWARNHQNDKGLREALREALLKSELKSLADKHLPS